MQVSSNLSLLMSQDVFEDYAISQFNNTTSSFLEHEIAYRHTLLDIMLSNGKPNAPLLYNLLNLPLPMGYV